MNASLGREPGSLETCAKWLTNYCARTILAQHFLREDCLKIPLLHDEWTFGYGPGNMYTIIKYFIKLYYKMLSNIIFY